MLPHGDSGVPPAPPTPPPPPPPLQVDDEEEDNNDEEFFAGLPTDAEGEENAAEQRAILASFETRHRDEMAQ
jgi:hypothetical protein